MLYLFIANMRILELYLMLSLQIQNGINMRFRVGGRGEDLDMCHLKNRRPFGLLRFLLDKQAYKKWWEVIHAQMSKKNGYYNNFNFGKHLSK